MGPVGVRTVLGAHRHSKFLIVRELGLSFPIWAIGPKSANLRWAAGGGVAVTFVGDAIHGSSVGGVIRITCPSANAQNLLPAPRHQPDSTTRRSWRTGRRGCHGLGRLTRRDRGRETRDPRTQVPSAALHSTAHAARESRERSGRQVGAAGSWPFFALTVICVSLSVTTQTTALLNN